LLEKLTQKVARGVRLETVLPDRREESGSANSAHGHRATPSPSRCTDEDFGESDSELARAERRVARAANCRWQGVN
jgi:hypothetical protein